MKATVRSVTIRTVMVWLGAMSFAYSAIISAVNAEGLSRITPDDVLRFDSHQSLVISPDGQALASVRRWIDPQSYRERFSLWLIDGEQAAEAVELGEPDARLPVWSPDGRWLAIRSTRPRPEGWPPTPAVPEASEAATDLWLISRDGTEIRPLAGPEKTYGRVFQDSFYGRVAFSPDGTKIVFVADDGREPRTPQELASRVIKFRPDQGEGYTGYGPAQVWIAELGAEGTHVASRIRRLTNDQVWYGDPQWTPDGLSLIVHANKSAEKESVRFSINKNYDLWRIDANTGEQTQLTTQPGPDVSPRISPDGRQIAYLSVPRQGPHADVYNLALWSVGQAPRTVRDFHSDSTDALSLLSPSFPLPDDCWQDEQTLSYLSFQGLKTESIRCDLATSEVRVFSADSRPVVEIQQSDTRRQLQSRLPASNPFLKERLIAEDRKFTWKREGWELEGALTVPPEDVAQAPYPIVVFPHGGPHSRATLGFHLTAQVLAGAGYLVFQPNFRGSAGYGRRFLDADRHDLGGGDAQDILTGISALVDEKLADPDRQFLYGVSYGGYMTTSLVGQTRQFRAAVAQNAVTHLDVMWGLGDLPSWTEWEFSGRPWMVAEAMRQHSPFAHAGKVVTPTLILHSQDDRRCPIAMGVMFHQALRAQGVRTEMVVYPGEGHGIRQPLHQRDVLQRLLNWIRRHDPVTSIGIVTLGDSITRGVRSGVTAAETFSALLEEQLWEAGHPVQVTNVGIGGERTDQALKRLDRDVIAKRPRIVTIMYGTNDSYVDVGKSESRISVAAYRSNLQEIVTKLRAAAIQPVLMTEPRWGQKARKNGLGEHPNVRLEIYVQACREVAGSLNVPLVDHYQHWTDAEGQGQVLGAWTTDQCHPNATGHAVLAERLQPVVEQLIPLLPRIRE